MKKTMYAGIIEIRKGDAWHPLWKEKDAVSIIQETQREVIEFCVGYLQNSGVGYYDFRISVHRVEVHVDIPTMLELEKEK